MRKGVKADKRLEFEQLFFDQNFQTPLSQDTIWKEELEAVRLAPSATNQQPRRVVVEGNCAHFYEKQTIPTSAIGDVEKVDMGIALCHFDLIRLEKGIQGSFIKTDQPESEYEYIVTLKRVASGLSFVLYRTFFGFCKDYNSIRSSFFQHLNVHLEQFFPTLLKFIGKNKKITNTFMNILNFMDDKLWQRV